MITAFVRVVQIISVRLVLNVDSTVLARNATAWNATIRAAEDSYCCPVNHVGVKSANLASKLTTRIGLK